jgi:hypothetical protein
VIANEGGKADVCWVVIANDGKESRGCHSGMGAGKTERISAFQCGTKNGGCRGIRLTTYTPK